MMKSNLFKFSLCITCALLLLAIPSASEAQAKPSATFTVTNLNNSGTGSLRWAINQANLAGGTNTLNFSVSGTINLAWSLPWILSDTIINGPAGGIVINGGGSRVFFVPAQSVLSLTNITITNGFNGEYLGGGAIYNLGTVNLDNCTLFGNSASNHGGAIFNDWGVVNITNSTIRDNTAGISGGGLFTVMGTVRVTGSTFSGNNAWAGGGLYVFGWVAFVDVRNSTFSGNSAVTSVGGNGGAIYVDNGILVHFYNSTIASNYATLYGGIYNSSGRVTLMGTIIANNSTAGNCSGAGTFWDYGYNLEFPAASGCVSTSGDPKLGPLAYNGGPTKTMALGSGSAAINLVFPSPYTCSQTDQRGFARNLSDGYCDAGAFEYGAGNFLYLPLIRK